MTATNVAAAHALVRLKQASGPCRLKQESTDPLRATPMQREARKKAARDLSEQRDGGWFGRLHQVFRSNMGGSAEQQENAARAARGQVGYRKRAMRARQEETIPVHRALVPASYYPPLPRQQ